MFSKMDLQKKIDELKDEREREELKKSLAHERIKAINRQIGKLETAIKHAEEILQDGNDKPSDNEESKSSAQRGQPKLTDFL